MQFPAWTRLVNLYSARIARLLAGEGSWEQLVLSPEFRRDAHKVAEAMVSELAKVNAKSWREAAFRSGNGRKIYEALQREIRTTNLQPYLEQIARRNAELIRSVPQKVAFQVSQHAQTLYLEGKRPAEIEKELKRVAPKMRQSHIELISRTSVSTAETDITRARAESIDISAYQWASSEDSRVRPSHRKMDKVLVFWNDPPSPEALIGERDQGHYHAGQWFRCRCLCLPIISLDEISFPARLYRAGSIQRITRGNFAALAGYKKAA